MSKVIYIGIIILIILIVSWETISYFTSSKYSLLNGFNKPDNSDDSYLQQMKGLKYDSDFDTAVAYHNLG